MAVAKVIRRKQNSDLEGGFSEQAQSDARYQRLLAKHELKKTLRSRADILAQDFEFIKFYPVPLLSDLYPNKPWMWHVHRYYPHAEGGALYIDEPNTLAEFVSLKRKEQFLRAQGYRYVLLDPTKTQYDDALELKKCGQQQPTA